MTLAGLNWFAKPAIRTFIKNGHPEVTENAFRAGINSCNIIASIVMTHTMLVFQK